MKLVTITRSLLRSAAAAALALSVAGCATTPATSEGETTVNDPLEGPNRVVFAVNEAADKVVIRPVTEVYVAVVPDPLRQAVHTFIQNLMSPLYIANHLLQGNFEGAQLATGRFMTNTILGLGGIADVASEAGLPEKPADFGQTLGVWGLGSGPYLVLPLLGPSNVRDAVGYGVDTLGDPFRIWTNGVGQDGLQWGRTGASGVDRRSQVLREIDDLRRNSIDFYATVRSLYAQQRDAAIRGSSAPANPEFPEFPEYNTPAKK
ncbi:MlaA family lipoprotein [Azospirillum rugosum]|uniref:Phospholipid-binding lipoprotein MlaA n=1 Tax=Azospirillum rugosum TaxID=416170 RepID=A0ABS4SMN5_9PROT|nr:VacJ family lipoprotein [Azospirillum rugosum]MBP2293494.1 phospholipid-binding lipoprotein MlaA [Azospirillum rugosum]MDQ0529173.1 phospholipid-binding lipoprotein MlaA [Azospirillum rugosum]